MSDFKFKMDLCWLSVDFQFSSLFLPKTFSPQWDRCMSLLSNTIQHIDLDLNAIGMVCHQK